MKSDYIVVKILNNGFAFVEMEDKVLETTAAVGEAFIAFARKANYKETSYVAYSNGDKAWFFN